jgi:hypothetical protein
MEGDKYGMLASSDLNRVLETLKFPDHHLLIEQGRQSGDPPRINGAPGLKNGLIPGTPTQIPGRVIPDALGIDATSRLFHPIHHTR